MPPRTITTSPCASASKSPVAVKPSHGICWHSVVVAGTGNMNAHLSIAIGP